MKTNKREGSILAAAMIFAVVSAAMVGTYLKLVMNELRIADQAFQSNAAINAAEAGLEQAAYALNREDWSGWHTVAVPNGQETETMRYASLPPVDLGKNNICRAQIMVKDYGTRKPIVYTRTVIDQAYGLDVDKQVEIKLKSRSRYDIGTAAEELLENAGNNVGTTGYSSSEGPPGPDNNIDMGSYGSLRYEDTVTGVDLSNANVWGYVMTGGADITWGPDAYVKGEDTPPGVEIDPQRLRYDWDADFPDEDPPAYDPAEHGTYVSSPPIGRMGADIGTDGAASYVDYTGESITLAANKTLMVHGDVTMVVNDLSIVGNGGIKLAPDAKLKLYIEGDFDCGGNGIANLDAAGGDPGVPADMQVFGTNDTDGATTWKLHGNGAASGAFYAPNSSVHIGGGGCNGDFYGVVIGHEIKINGVYMLYYDVDLRDLDTDDGWDMRSWRELTNRAEMLQFPDYNTYPSLEFVFSGQDGTPGGNY